MIEQIKYYKNIICQEEIKRTFNIPDFANRVPQGNGNGRGYLSAGLPNITGQIGYCGETIYISDNGCVYKSDTAAGSFQITGSAQRGRWNIDASRSSSIYGSSNTVQPPATKVNFVIKY